MAISTANVYLMYKTTSGGSYSPMVAITEFPDMWSAPDTIDTTTMSDGQSLSIPDIVKLNNLEFSAFYEKDTYTKGENTYIAADTLFGLDSQDKIWYQLCFGSTSGSQGKLSWTGKQSSGIKGGSVSAAVEVGISIYPDTAVTYSA